jgi:hypothetical protein
MKNIEKDYLKIGVNNIDCLRLGFFNLLGVILSHPFDTLKVHTQLNFTYTPVLSLKSIYKGFLPTLVGIKLEKLVVFRTYNYCIEQNLNVPLSGAISGLVGSFITTPYERIKILQQTKQPINPLTINNLFKGIGITSCRDSLGYTICFSTYEILKGNFIDTYDTTKIPLFLYSFYGGISGATASLFTYYHDRYKTILQSNNISKYKKFLTSKNTGLYQTMFRAYILHYGAFAIMEYLNQ